MEGLVIGLINAVTSLLIIVAYVPCLKVIGFDPDFKESSCFQIMFHLGCSDVLQASTEFLFAVLTFTGVIAYVPEWLNCLIAPIAGSCWFSYTTFLLLLSINRMSIITNKLTWLFSKKITTGLITVSWVYSLAWLVLLETKMVKYCYYLATYTFYYGMNSSMSVLAMQLDWVHDQFCIWPSIACYIISFYTANRERKALAQGTGSVDDSLKESELVLLKQGFLIFVYCVIQAQYFHAAPLLHGEGFPFAFAIGNWLWLSNAGVNPIIYLCMNKTIRYKVKEIFGWKPPLVSPANQSKKVTKKTVHHKDDGAVIEDIP